MVRELLARLPEALAEIAIHSYVDEMTQDEIAKVAGCSRRACLRAPAGARRVRGRRSAASLTSSAANEDAQESDALKGSFFTHYLVSALLGAGDADGDGNVTLEEAYRYAYDATLRSSSQTFAGLQQFVGRRRWAGGPRAGLG